MSSIVCSRDDRDVSCEQLRLVVVTPTNSPSDGLSAQ
jgi:hypothetical protein